MPSTTSTRPPKRLAVFCDGTWVGRETAVDDAPPSNIRQLANMVGNVEYTSNSVDKTAAKVYPIKPHKNPSSTSSSDKDSTPTITAGYQEGVGLNKNFLQYIWDGATASSISDECISVYKYIVENYTDSHEIWLFGFSRGAFTVRCVAGMINNCGIIKRRAEYSDAEVSRLCYEVFRTYRSGLPGDAPKSDECRRWKGLGDRVWQVKRPIRFMGIIDTVGALGIPRLNAGIGFDWSPFEFFDHSVSSVVQRVYHAPCLHDRLWIFQPCLIFPSPEEDRDGDGVVDQRNGDGDGTSGCSAQVTQKWFPGTHYDVGRMTFRFLRQSPTNWIEEALGWLPDLLSRTVYPNQVLGDAVLRWMVESVLAADEDSDNPLMPTAPAHIQALSESLAANTRPAVSEHDQRLRTGSGDIYGDVLAYAPGGVLISSLQTTSRSLTSLLNGLFPKLGDNIQGVLGVKTLVSILTNTADRRIPGAQADVYPYTEEETVLVDGKEVRFSIESLARLNEMNERGKLRYPSQTFEAFSLWKRVFGREGVH
ncbi:peptidoglycan binding domain-containing protein [Stemphylium lycopersici]|uniref:Peptidoglycan binding domain-containing protein n=1 Tax=Stemphylium lycopersici TaxID=183478 RepID=A0A364N8V7_STELY|nr:peptidoglycan binding domain-containing protein [Stemphylium lycopersici]